MCTDMIRAQKPTVWARQNAGVQARAARDVELEAVSKPTLDSARAILERKARVYEKLSRGKSGGLSEKQYEALLVDVRRCLFVRLCCAEEMWTDAAGFWVWGRIV